MSAKLGNGTVTFGDSTVQSTAATASFPSPGYALFTASGTSSWTCPVGVNRVLVLVIGGGGGGVPTGYGYSLRRGGWGGHAACIFNVTPSTSYSYTIGQGGIGDNGAGPGGTGGTSSFNGVLSATGGAGCTYSTQGNNASIGTCSSNSTNVYMAYQPWGAAGSGGGYYDSYCAPANGVPITSGNNPWTGDLVYIESSGATLGYIVPGSGGSQWNDPTLGYIGTAGCNGIVYIQYIG